MDIEKLTKSQVVLLTLLVSFVTSIATGIVTVSLMQQAPPTVAQTVNRIIENTIERVATSTRGQAAAPVVTQEKTVIVNEAGLIAQAVKQISPSIVAIYSAEDQTQFLGLGTVADASGTIVSDIGAFGDRADATIVLQSGAKLRAFVTSRDSTSGLLYLTPATTTTSAIVWTPAPLAASAPVLGELVVAIGGGTNPQIEQGIITQITPAGKGAAYPELISTNINPSAIQPGSVIIDSSADVIGVSTGVSRTSYASAFVPALLVGVTDATSHQN